MTISEARKLAGLSQREMSRLMHIPLSTVEAWCRGSRTPAPYLEDLVIEKLQRIAAEKYNLIIEEAPDD